MSEHVAGSKNFNILSLDGGGIKGILSAAVLANIEEDCNTRIIDHFDLIVGTSTGGIIALGLGSGLRPREIVDFYVKNGPHIFSSACGLRSIRHWVRYKFSPDPLILALKECFKETLLGQSTKRLVIPAFNLTSDDVYVFKTPHHSRFKRDHKVQMWKVAAATSAAPTYFPYFPEVDKMRMVDGGVWANNPILVGVVEAVVELGATPGYTKVLSLGTSEAIVNRPRRLNRGGKFSWIRRNGIVEVILRSQSRSAINLTRKLIGENNVYRLDAIVTDGRFTLDNFGSSNDLIATAADISRKSMPEISRLFLGHKAEDFVSLVNPRVDL